MVTDSIANASIPMPAPKDFNKKKRGNNRTAKLKQCKLDARREQWLSQVKKKGCKEDEVQALHVGNGGKKTETGKLEIKTRDVHNHEPVHHCSEAETPSNSPNSSILGSNISGTNFTTSTSGGSSTSGSFSGSVTGEDEDDCFDDWEAMADALALSEEKHKPELPIKDQTQVELPSQVVELPKVEKTQKPPVSGQAWKPNDAFRPQSLPNLAKQNSFPSGKSYSCLGGGVWSRKSVASAPKSCPICCEDLDYTDTSFHPCECGFRLCLFCHKRILEEDGRCPGCRKPYEHERETGFRLGRSCSMITRF